MLKNPIQIAILFAVVSLIIKVSVFLVGIQHGKMETYIWFIYLLILLIAVFFGIRSNKIKQERTTSFGEDFRFGARTASMYAILMTIITFFYYEYIDIDFFETKKSQIMEAFPEKINYAIHEKGLSIKEVKEFVKNDIMTSNTIFSSQFHAMVTLFGLVFIGMINSLVFAFMMKKFPGFKK